MTLLNKVSLYKIYILSKVNLDIAIKFHCSPYLNFSTLSSFRLCCPRNWLVVPRIDIHDILDFVCPTSKLIVKQVNYQTRVGESMNFNLFRREWPGSVTELQQSISNGSIHSFCNASHQGIVIERNFTLYIIL